jgi:hypothetical protein
VESDPANAPAKVANGAVALNATLVAPAGTVSTMVTWLSAPIPVFWITVFLVAELAKV